MAVEIGTLVLKGRFGATRSETTARRDDLEEALAVLRQDLLREMDDKLEAAERRARER
ncbi:MAG: hypothetical protein AAF999_14130 [Pseudomonadota bacterium]